MSKSKRKRASRYPDHTGELSFARNKAFVAALRDNPPPAKKSGKVK